MSSFDELSHDHPEPRAGLWRKLDPPVRVRAYFANQWHDSLAVDVNDETRELRVELPQGPDEHGVDVIRHKVLDASLYQAPAGAL